MKNLKKIIAWTAIAIVIQHTIFLYLENVYCATDIDTTAEKVETQERKNNDKMEIEIKPGVTNLTVSSDGRFVAYLDNGKLKVLDSSDNTEKEFENIYNSEERYSGEGEEVESSTSDSTDKDTSKNANKNTNNNTNNNTDKNTNSNENKKTSTNTSTVKQNESKKDNETTNNNNQNINGVGNSSINENTSTSTPEGKVDKPESNTGNTTVTETPGNAGVGPWNDVTSTDTPATGTGSIDGQGNTGVGPWNDDISTDKTDTNTSNTQGPESTEGKEFNSESTEVKENITYNTDISRTINTNPMLLAGTNIFGNELENITLLSNKGTTAKTIDAEIVFYKWLPNESNMIVIRKIKENGVYYFEPISFDAKKGKVRELADFDLNKMRIELQNTEDKVDDIAFSTSTNSLYIKIKKANGNSSLYYVNVMNQLERVKYNTSIGKVVVPTTNANAVIEENSEIKMLNNGEVLIPNVENAKILGTDSSDNVYFGELINGKINKIYYTVLSDKNRIWNELALAKPVEQEDIVIDYSGKVYVNNKLDSNVLELTTNKTISYNGDLLQSYSKGIIVKSGDTLLKTNIEE